MFNLKFWISGFNLLHFAFITHFLVQPIRIRDLKKVDPLKACKYFNDCFKDPSTFTVVLVGNFDPTSSLPLILQYLVRFASWNIFSLDYPLSLLIVSFPCRVEYQNPLIQLYISIVMTWKVCHSNFLQPLSGDILAIISEEFLWAFNCKSFLTVVMLEIWCWL